MKELEVTGTAHLQLTINISADYVLIKKEELEKLKRTAVESGSAASKNEPKNGLQPTLTMEQVSHYLGIGRTRAFHLIKSGELSSYKIGKSRRVRRADLLEFEDRLRKEEIRL
ncbi:helix-turn-helix domain-containing protein [Cohnella sp. GbtcB17]|uniref:helix-turn-helix domain-containing protein n=1 Tax=Cohnella sp. GbtcB17 TaxID=2824762 RepID=UPI001C306B71|nr:helix-turn-helix domain-containing protein [Cohnella sp. GbtcB17]